MGTPLGPRLRGDDVEIRKAPSSPAAKLRGSVAKLRRSPRQNSVVPPAKLRRSRRQKLRRSRRQKLRRSRSKAPSFPRQSSVVPAAKLRRSRSEARSFRGKAPSFAGQKLRRSRESGNPVSFARTRHWNTPLGPRFRGDDEARDPVTPHWNAPLGPTIAGPPRLHRAANVHMLAFPCICP